VAPTAQAVFITFQAVGADAASITSTRDAFRTAVGGGTVAGANGSFGGVRREINWDGVPDASADPNPLAANFFNTTSPRGVVLSTPGSGFLVSANAGQATPTVFGFPNDLTAFSPQRLFTAVNSNITDVNFFLPGSGIPATVSAFGVVFTDVQTDGDTKIEFFDSSNTLIHFAGAATGPKKGLTFVGAVANAGERISRVRILSGSSAILSNGVQASPTADLVAMDDFIYAEPVPEPAAAATAALVAAGCLFRRRRR